MSILVFTTSVQSQNIPQSHKIYNAQNGFKIKAIQSMEFDNNGWLWVSGITLSPNKYRFDDYDGIIQRFNGSTFQDIKLPEIENVKIASVYIKKRQDNLLYVLLGTRSKPKLYLLDPSTIKFTPIVLPIIEDTGIYDLSFLQYKDHFLLFTSNNKESFLYRLNTDLSIVPLGKIPENRELIANHLLEFEDHFIINDERSGVLTFDNNGSFISKLDNKALQLDASLIDYKLNIQATFKYKDQVFAKFSAGSNKYYSYNSDSKKWNKASIFDKPNTSTPIQSNVINDSKGNTLRIDLKDSHILISRYLNTLNESDFEYSVNFKDMPQTASRNFEKEIFIAADGELHHIIFESSNFSLFLNDHGIRGILPLNKEEAIVGTDNRGWYKINLKTKQTQNYNVTLNDEPYSPNENRSFFKDKKGYWSTYSKGLVYVDDNSRELETYIHYPVATMIEDSSSIYYGTFKYKLMKFDKVSGEHNVLANTDTLDVQQIIKKDNSIYGATGSGLLLHQNNQTHIYKINENTDDNFLLSLKYTDQYGLLIGSRSGKLYQFDTSKKTFKTLYSDDLKASIATFLLDDHNRIWLNTFSGIVAFNPKNQKTIRYGQSDGMSHYESNRYSAAKTKNGYFLVGTLKGLNYFHPDSLSKNKIHASLQLSSITYYDKSSNKFQRELSSEKLNNLTSITLPAEHRNLNLEFGLLGMFINETVNYKYRFNNENWRDLERKNQLNLVSLAPGNYDLEVKALDSSQQKIGESLHLQIHAKNYIYKSFWFYLTLILLLGMIGVWYILQLKKQHQLKEQFSTQLINTQETERSRVAKELHDSIGQKLLLLKNTLLLKKEKEQDHISIVEETIHEVREMSHNLHPFQFEQIGLTQSLHNVIDAFQKTSPIFFSTDIEEVDDFIPKEKQIFIFRMLQECISNVIKHSKATACNLQVTMNGKSIQFQLKDNGQGFDPESYKNSTSSLGLRTLRERAQYIRAQLHISSHLKKGTITTIIVPVS